MLTAPGETYSRERKPQRRVPERAQRRDLIEDFADLEDEGGYNAGRRRTGLRLTFQGGIPQSMWGRVAAGAALFAILGVGWTATGVARRMVLRDERFVLQSSSSILTRGNHHLARAQMVNVFSDDIQRNILRTSLEDRKVELERIPWVKRATVMRLLPDRISVFVEERTPIAFVRQGGHIGLVDQSGVLFDMGSDKVEAESYSFPVVTGIVPADPLSVRAARMRIFQEFTKALDVAGENISARLSEVDLSNPEDIKALIPDHGADILVHFGDNDFLDRYRKYEAHLSEWRTQYPKLSSVDMRYERQVVLEMQAGAAVPLLGANAQEAVSAGRVGDQPIPAKRPLVPAIHSHTKTPPRHVAGHALLRVKATARVHSHVPGKAGRP